MPLNCGTRASGFTPLTENGDKNDVSEFEEFCLKGVMCKVEVWLLQGGLLAWAAHCKSFSCKAYRSGTVPNISLSRSRSSWWEARSCHCEAKLGWFQQVDNREFSFKSHGPSNDFKRRVSAGWKNSSCGGSSAEVANHKWLMWQVDLQDGCNSQFHGKPTRRLGKFPNLVAWPGSFATRRQGTWLCVIKQMSKTFSR